jgi:hypothetical protein
VGRLRDHRMAQDLQARYLLVFLIFIFAIQSLKPVQITVT